MKLTAEDISMIETPKGGFKYDSLTALGIPVPLKSGWRTRAIGTDVSEADFARAIQISEEPVVKVSKSERRHRSAGQQSLL